MSPWRPSLPKEVFLSNRVDWNYVVTSAKPAHIPLKQSCGSRSIDSKSIIRRSTWWVCTLSKSNRTNWWLQIEIYGGTSNNDEAVLQGNWVNKWDWKVKNKMITYEIVAGATDGLLGAVIIVSMLVNWGILISYQEFPPMPMTEMGSQFTGLCCRWVRDVSEINQSLQPMGPVIESTSTPTRPLKRAGLTSEAYEIIKYRSGICYFAIHVWLRDHVHSELRCSIE